MKKHLLPIIILLILALTVSVFMGCAPKTPAAPSGGGTQQSSGGTQQSSGGSASSGGTQQSSGGTQAVPEGKHYVFRVGATSEAWRPEAVIEAAKRLNKQLAAEGNPDTVEVEYEVVEDWNSSFTLWSQENTLPEIVCVKLGMAFKQGMAGNVVECDYVVNDDVYSAKVPQNLREMGMVEGKYWGIILDTETRFVVVNKLALIELGWTEEQIEAWKQEARAGKITTKDLQDLAKQVVDAGICQYGITHRPNSGSDWQQTYVTWNHGVVPMNEKGQHIVNRQNLIDFMTFWRECVQMGITPYNHLTDFNWDMLEGDIWPNGKAFCWYAQIATKSDCTNTGLTGEEFEKNFFSIPNPVTRLGDKPYAGCSPYMFALTTASQKDEKTAEYVRRILDNVLDPDIQLTISLDHSHIAITDECVATPEYSSDAWMQDQAYITPYMGRYSPSSLKADLQDMLADSKDFFAALQEAEVTANDPNARPIETIVDEMIQKCIFNMGEGNYVLE